MSQITGGAWSLGWVAAKAFLLYLTAVFGLRLGERRTLAEMSGFDFVAAVACGAIVGRVPNSTSTSYAQGAVTLAAILVTHFLISRLRLAGRASKLFNHSPCVLAAHGQVYGRELRRCGLTEEDLDGMIREHGLTDLSEVGAVIFEQRGKVSVLPEICVPAGAEPPMIRKLLNQTVRGQ